MAFKAVGHRKKIVDMLVHSSVGVESEDLENKA